MSDFYNYPTYTIDHGNKSYEMVMEDRLNLMTDIKNHFRKLCKYRDLVFKLLKGIDPPRDQYDFEISRRVYHYMSKLPFRKDVKSVETIQYPDVTLKHGGDCDCLSLAFATICEAGGTVTNWLISKQHGSDYDHIAAFVPGVGVADLTYPGKVFPLPTEEFREAQII